MATEINELIQFWKEELAGPPRQHSWFRRQKIRDTIRWLESIEKLLKEK